MKRQLLTGIGLAVALAGFVMVFEPALARALATSRSMVVLVGVLALVQGFRVARDRRRAAVETADTGNPETEQDLPVPGDDFDELIAHVHRLHSPGLSNARTPRRRRDSFVRHRRRIRRRLEDAAVATITRKYGCTEAEAQEAIERGTWTDDPFAAAFFTGSLEGVGLLDRIGLKLTARGSFERRAVHAAEAIAELSDSDRLLGEVGAS